MDRIDLTGSYTPDVSQSNQNAEALREHQLEVEKAAQLKQQLEQEALVESGEASGPTLEPSEVEQVYEKYQDDPNVEIIDGKPFYKKNSGGNIYAQSDEGTFAETADVITERLSAPGAGLASFVTKAIGLIPGFEKVRGAVPDFDDPVAQGVREVSEVVVPTLLGTGAVVGAGRAAGANMAMGAIMIWNFDNNQGVDASSNGISNTMASLEFGGSRTSGVYIRPLATASGQTNTNPWYRRDILKPNTVFNCSFTYMV